MPYMKCKQRPNRSTLLSCIRFQTHLISTVPFPFTPHAVPCEFVMGTHIQLFWGLSNCWHDSVSDMVRGCPGHMCTSLDCCDRLAGYGLTLTVSHTRGRVQWLPIGTPDHTNRDCNVITF